MIIDEQHRVAKKVDVAIDLVPQAWAAACIAQGREAASPTAVVPLKPQRPNRKSGVYRLVGAGDGGAAVIAKRCRRSTWSIERRVYEQVLPRLGVPTLRYYGSFEEAGSAFGWLFIEDAGEAKLTHADRESVAEWLARLHTGSEPLQREVTLPDRGPAHYLRHLREGRKLIDAAMEELELASADRDALRTIQDLGSILEERWEQLRAPCAAAPRTLVHGDFSRKNVRVRRTPEGPLVLVLDWETAGWGPPAADLPFTRTRCVRHRPDRPPGKPPSWDGTVPLDVYAAHCGGRWDGPRRRHLELVAHVGTVFRIVAGVRWAAERRDGQIFSGMTELRWYAELLPRALRPLMG